VREARSAEAANEKGTTSLLLWTSQAASNSFLISPSLMTSNSSTTCSSVITGSTHEAAIRARGT
jgi:hypothetical protein